MALGSQHEVKADEVDEPGNLRTSSAPTSAKSEGKGGGGDLRVKSIDSALDAPKAKAFQRLDFLVRDSPLDEDATVEGSRQKMKEYVRPTGQPAHQYTSILFCI